MDQIYALTPRTSYPSTPHPSDSGWPSRLLPCRFCGQKQTIFFLILVSLLITQPVIEYTILLCSQADHVCKYTGPCGRGHLALGCSDYYIVLVFFL